MRMDTRTRVTCIDTQFLYIHRISLIAVGLWPYDRTMLVQLQSSLFFLITTSIIIFQLTTFLTTECTIDFIIKILSTTLFLLVCVIQYNCFWINTRAVKHVLENLLYICSKLHDRNEIAIIKKYGYIAKCVAIGFISVGTLVGTGILITGYFIHFCGLFNVASYRMQQVMRRNSHELIYRKHKSEIEKKISHAVDIHRATINIIEFFLYNFEGTFILVTAIIVICLSLHLFGIYQAAMFEKSIEEFLLHFGFMSAIFLYSFAGNYVGQAITDHYNNIFSNAYNVKWYTASVRVQRLILILLQICAKPYGLKFGGLFITSLENFASLSTASMSYFTILYSIQK
ncbi:odorant receptor 22c-like isoform X3 [Ooceraea biroi]|uniref:odorant receptor 22c-like isoform X3 n=1 Tax=Ooceraea biroi TaxID=2015173 RepID=UPI000F07F779|nr:odorant receptor 22c-like isoform X3 [Ooceraea biroi]